MAGLIACVYAGAVWCIWVFTNRVVGKQVKVGAGGERVVYIVLGFTSSQAGNKLAKRI